MVIDRFPEQSIISSASHCDSCQTRLRPLDLIPILSQVFNRFRCRYCKVRYPVWYALFELVLGLLFLLYSWELLSLGQVVLITAGLTLGIYDFHHQEYPLLVWMTFHLILIASSGWNLVMVSFLALGILAHFIDIRMGAGDFLFLASCALVFSVTELLILIQFASATGILAFILQKKKERLPFVPFLLLATCLIIFGKLLLV
ncbi:type IV leader peptidase family protein [Streptococcus pneumoniae GA18523]|uniref:prepilin peptidase n=1 Tax=Streptococcus pneumoniae TaxID=1313 RepID=UPI00020451CC|nr:A24 family peptidase [Streptococcus pneumoniae]EGE88321.1 type IV leader peptidase family protein [Streptococcus pneumoniae GA04375]EHD26851.1 type IV leader peptidase family protein [Streptococcus pneumoniae GA11184]EHD48677.1 type IV leader peptidase family protein [Streptococcus pneumoniae 6901-05]EHD71575.1 type IV leader peptidase family protein [Streptococcus pneumoniae GA18523]EHD94730.1 type IV leader peptidase family protein [Streptococcus pneumoniae GA14798]EHD97292.1 type IV lea